MPSDSAGSFTDVLGGYLGSPGVETALRLALLGCVIAWGVTLVWASRDAAARSRNPILVVGAGAAVLAATPLGFPLAIMLWMLVRPRQTVAEIEEQRLTITALDAEAHGDRCPGCRLQTNPEWRRCPRCRTWLRAICPRCERIVELDASICPWCVFDLPPGVLRPDARPRRDLVPVMAPPTPGAAAASAFPPAMPQPAPAVDARRSERGRPGPPAAYVRQGSEAGANVMGRGDAPSGGR
jgi:hypothetical protein